MAINNTSPAWLILCGIYYRLWWKVISVMLRSSWAARGEAAVSHCHWLEPLGGVWVQSLGNQQHRNRRAQQTLQKGPHQRNAYVSEAPYSPCDANINTMFPDYSHHTLREQWLDHFKKLHCTSSFQWTSCNMFFLYSTCPHKHTWA